MTARRAFAALGILAVVVGLAVWLSKPPAVPPAVPQCATAEQLILVQDEARRNDNLLRADVAILEAKVKLLEVRVRRLERVVPVQAIRDRAKAGGR